MWRLIKCLLKREDGATLVLVALGMSVFMGMAAVVTDVGMVFLAKTKLTNALDAAVLAGAQELPANPVAAKATALNYLALNGEDPNTVEVIFENDNKALTVKGKRTVKLFFAKFLGKETSEVAASSKGVVGTIIGMNGVVPLSIQEQNLIFGHEYILKSGTSDTGWFGPIALGGNGAKVYLLNLESSYNGYLKVGDTLPTEPGNMSGPTEEGIEYRINQDPHYPKCTPTEYKRSCPRIIYLPVVSPPDGGGSSAVTIKGFAAFLVTDAEVGAGNESIVRGYFLNEIVPGDIDTTSNGFGLNGVKLVQ
jgi:hypothetical protein